MLVADLFTLSDIMAYFEGSPDGLIRGHERAAEEIALAGRKFTEERWRWVDMQSYMLLMLLEVRSPGDSRRPSI